MRNCKKLSRRRTAGARSCGRQARRDDGSATDVPQAAAEVSGFLLDKATTSPYTCIVTQMSKRPSNSRGCRSYPSELAGLLNPRFFKALGDPSRIAILVRLTRLGGSSTVSEIAACCPTDFSVVSRHLAILRDAGILVSKKQGKEVHYSVRFPELVATLRGVADALDACCAEARAAKGRTP